MDVACNLKSKYIQDFNKYRQQLHKGYKPDYKLLLNEIVVIENSDYFDINTYEYLMSV